MVQRTEGETGHVVNYRVEGKRSRSVGYKFTVKKVHNRRFDWTPFHTSKKSSDKSMHFTPLPWMKYTNNSSNLLKDNLRHSCHREGTVHGIQKFYLYLQTPSNGSIIVSRT